MREFSAQSEDMPDPAAALVLWRVSVEAFLEVSSRKKGEEFLSVIAGKLASEESLSQVLTIRPEIQRSAVQRARREAGELFRRYLPVFLARLPRK